tara:strand:- start:883 stop:1014 length:132 start_codon:yes stop_codon:yes gene_type:complete
MNNFFKKVIHRLIHRLIHRQVLKDLKSRFDFVVIVEKIFALQE